MFKNRFQKDLNPKPPINRPKETNTQTPTPKKPSPKWKLPISKTDIGNNWTNIQHVFWLQLDQYLKRISVEMGGDWTNIQNGYRANNDQYPKRKSGEQ